MRNIAIAAFVMIISGCATATVHDYCAAHEDSYSSYDECYSEVSENHKNWSVGKKIGYVVGVILGGAGRGANPSSNQSSIEIPQYQSTQVSCTTTPGFYGYQT